MGEFVNDDGDQKGQPTVPDGYELVESWYEKDVSRGRIDTGLRWGLYHGQIQQYQHAQKQEHTKDHQWYACGNDHPPQTFGAAQPVHYTQKPGGAKKYYRSPVADVESFQALSSGQFNG
jgi:hypothetical protein